MNERKSNLNRKNRAFTLCLALLLCLTLLWCGVGALGEDGTQPAEVPPEGGEVVEPQANENEPQNTSVLHQDLYEDGSVYREQTLDAGTQPDDSRDGPTKDGYRFTGWSLDTTNSTDTVKKYIPNYIAQSTISFDSAGGTAVAAITADEGTTINAPDEPNFTGHTFKGWGVEFPYTVPTDDVILTAQWEINYYTITWNLADGTTETSTVEYGATPTHEDDTKATADGISYKFAGWTPEVVAATENATYTSTFTKVFTITWKNADGTLIDTTQVEENQLPTHADPTKAEDAQYTYTFANWTPSPIAATANAEYTATFNQNLRAYTVTWKNEDGTVLETDASVNYGTTPEYDGAAPTKATDDANFYTFAGWADLAAPTTVIAALPTVSGDTTYVAVYTPESRTVSGSPFTYKLSEDKKEATIVAWDGTGIDAAGALIVPGSFTYNSVPVPVVAIGDNVIKDNSPESATPLVSLIISDGVKRIGAASLSNLTALTSLTLPDTLEALGENALVGNTALTTVTLRSTQQTTLTAATQVAHTITGADGQPTTASVTLPVAVTDIVVTKNGVQENPAALTLGDYTVQAGHGITVEQGASLTNAGTLNNLGTITNGGAFTNNTVLNSCAGTVVGEITNAATATYVANGQHKYENNVCTLCGAELPKLTVNYTGAKIKKTYDKTRNVSLKKADFNIENGDELGVNVSKISASYNKADAGKRTVNVTVTLGGDNAALYGGKATVSLSAEIEPKELIITPTAGQKKTYGASDPKNYTGKVKGLLSGDSITGKLGRDAGEGVGRYRITQGTISAGDNYAVEVLEEYFTIEAKSINSSDVGLVTIGNQRYTGQKVEPEITLKYGKATLKQGTDFKAEFTDNVQPGMATVKLTGIGNYTGSRESSFRILNIASGVSSGSSGSSGSGGGYSYGGFDDEDESDEDYEDEEEDAEVGRLVVSGEDYGTILFDASGKPSPFVQFEEEIELLQEGELTANPEEPLPWKLTIIADPMEDEETGETLLLDDGEREQYDELHLRLDTSLVDTLIEKGCTEIIYELDAAQLRVPLTSLVSEIELKDVASTEVVGTTEGDEGDLGDDVAVEEAVDEVEVALVDNTLSVAAYDICILQSEVAVLTQRELDAMNPYAAVSPAYELKVRAVLEGEEGATVTLTDDGETIDPSAAQRLPDYGWPVDLVLRMAPSEELEEPDEVDGESDEAADETVDGEPVKMTYPDIYALFVSTVEDETVDPDVVTLDPAEFVDEDGLFYAEVHATGDGLYGVVRPAELAGENGETEDAGEELEDIGGSTASGLSSIGGSFTLDENGNPVLEN